MTTPGTVPLRTGTTGSGKTTNLPGAITADEAVVDPAEAVVEPAEAVVEPAQADEVSAADEVTVVDPAAAVDAAHLTGTRLSRMVGELRAVTWPTRSQFLNYTAIVVTFLVVMTTLVGLVDSGLSALVLGLLG